MKSAYIKWLCENGFSNVDIDYEDDFGYAYDDYINCINIGRYDVEEVGTYFEQFLYEYGCEYVGIPAFALCFLHELGHHMTVNNFTSSELALYAFAKQWDHNRSTQEEYYHYWEMPDEFAANMWEIDFINNHIDAVEELVNIFIGVGIA